ncbi:uncharacterized protein LOC118503260 isoform X1 [Anopheles stephensi]|uniref:uncharacterized protein LOC118503260 isoform X1 n=2 Tax=Anopheles stephensi TaxID=30069 RepID=UPI001658B2C8|nr:uncharacterized protein LOC118503260 isoform X1 [Anopheles stephensi]
MTAVNVPCPEIEQNWVTQTKLQIYVRCRFTSHGKSIAARGLHSWWYGFDTVVTDVAAYAVAPSAAYRVSSSASPVGNNMLGSPVEVRYGDGDAVVLIRTDAGAARTHNGSGDGSSAKEPSQNVTHNSPASVAGTPESRRIIIRDAHGTEGCGSITIVTPTNNLKISINTKRYDRQNGFQAAKRTLANDLRNKLGELDELLKACDDDEGIDQRGEPSAGERPTTVTVQSQPADFAVAATAVAAASHGMVSGGGGGSMEPSSAIVPEPNRRCLVRFEDATKRRFAQASITRCSRSQRLLQQTSSALGLVESSDNGPQPQLATHDSSEHDTPGSSSSVRTIRFPPEFSSLVCTSQLPYDLKALHWDAHHRVNKTGNYCYCGNDGDWAREMIQCRRCEQWFHGRCVRSLQFPIFHGDTFYVFICSICNHGHEFVRRLVLSALNLVHLVLYNLIMRNGLRFYGLRTAIIPYIEDNQRTLQLSDQFVKLSAHERADLLLQALKSNKDRFLNGKECSLSLQLWTLRQPLPPPTEPITIPIPAVEIVTESMLQQKLDITEHFRFLPRVYHEKNYFMDGATRERMLGLNYAGHPASVEDPRMVTADVVSTPSSTSTAHPEQQSISNFPINVPPLPPADGSKALVGARRRKRFGIRPTPVVKPLPSDGLGAIIPPPADFIGPNHPFYEEESSSGSSGNSKTRYHCRKIGTMKRRAFDMNQRYLSNAKRRKLSHSGASFLFPLSQLKEAMQTQIVRKRVLSDVLEESPNTLSWLNVQRHNSEQSMSGGGTFDERPSATCSSSSCTAEQVDATAAGSVFSDASCAEEKPLASGRRLSGRLVALGTKNYSDTRRNKRRREQPASSSSQKNGRTGRRRRSEACGGDDDDDPTDHSNGDRLSMSDFASSADSSCCVRNAYWDPETVPQPPPAVESDGQKQNRPACVVMGKRTLPDGKKELLLELN